MTELFRDSHARLCKAILGMGLVIGVLFITRESRGGEVALAKTPPMGWNSWNCFRLEISDSIIRAEAEAMATNGMKAAGYQYIVIDGGWEGFHDEQGIFHPNAKKFPDMKGLCDYIHGLGLKVGIHTSPGPKTCAGHEGSYGHEKQDAETFAGWGIDFVKYDWCSGDQVYKPEEMPMVYRKMSEDLKVTGRPILFSLCQYGIADVWKWGASAGGQMWRTTGDIADNYNSIMLHGLAQNGLEAYAGPGHWNDPDMLEVGNRKLTDDEGRSQMSLWCLLAAPLFAGDDLTRMSAQTLALLTNREVIAVDQDAAGIQGHCVKQTGPTQIWTKALADGGTAIGLFNLNNHEMTVATNFKELGLPEKVAARDLWQQKNLGKFETGFSFTVPSHGSILLKVK